MSPPLLLIFLWCSWTSATSSCEWPNFFLIKNAEKRSLLNPEETSWETEGRIEESGLSYVNDYRKSNMWVKPVGKDKIEISTITELSRSHTKVNITTLTCEKDFGNNKYLVKVNHTWYNDKEENISPPVTRQCLRLVHRSPFVLQWSRGPEGRDVSDCPDGFKKLSSWPLVYFPIRKVARVKDSEKYPELQDRYQACPKLGGFQMRVLDKNGEPLGGEGICPSEDPSPRLELECYHGDGMRILQNHPHCSFYSKQANGWKLNCLGSWKEGDHEFVVLVPNEKTEIHSLHCLRINYRNPTSERAILFLDTVCRSPSDLAGADISFLQLELTRKAISGVCDDFSDACSQDKCSKMPYSCLKTCDKCPDTTTIEFDKSIRGQWSLALKGIAKTVNIKEKSLSAFGIGFLRPYSKFDQDSKCYDRPSGWTNNVFEYVVEGPGDGEGCGPRVTQVTVKRVSESVILLHMPATAPLRENSDIVTANQWCRNNYKDIKNFKPLFRPDTPYMQISRSNSGDYNGYLTLVSQDNQKPTNSCVDFDKNTALKYVSHLEIFLKFKDMNGDQKMCKGGARINGNEWQLTYTCPDKDEIDTTFTCLGEYQVSTDYHAVVLKAPAAIVGDNVPLRFTDKYYCLLIPSKESDGRPLWFNYAGKCDATFASFVDDGLRQPLATLDIHKVLSGSSRRAADWTVGVLMLLFLAVRHSFSVNINNW